LRPAAWFEELGLVAGAQFHVVLEELDVAGWVDVRSVEDCPELSAGEGNLVTGRFITRGATNVVEARFSDGTVLTGTEIHPVWSLDRLDWIPLGELEIGEQVVSNDGPLHLVSRVAHNQPTDVFNIEVDCEHVYQVGDAGVLVHNAYPGDFATKKAPTPSMKSSPFGPKIEDAIPRGGVPKNWSKADIADAIDDYELSIASRYAEQRAFDAAGIGSATERLAHARRISQEEGFLASLRKALENRS
jgi:hypothetical protein